MNKGLNRNNESMRTEIFTLESKEVNEGKKIAFIDGGINRQINKANVKAKVKSIEESKQLSELIVVDGEKVVEEGLSLKDPISGLPIESSKAKDYLAIIDGQHRYMAIMDMRDTDKVYQQRYEYLMKKWYNNGCDSDLKPKEHTPKAPAQIKAKYPLNEEISIRSLILEMNNTSVRWDKKDFLKQALAIYPENESLRFIAKYMDMKHINIKKGASDDMLPIGGFKLTTLSKYLTYSTSIKELVIADVCRYGEEILEKMMNNKSKELVKRAEEIIKAGLEAGFTYRFLAKGFFIDWIIKQNGLGTDYKKVIEFLKNIDKETVGGIMEKAQKHNFMEILNERIK